MVTLCFITRKTPGIYAKDATPGIRLPFTPWQSDCRVSVA